MSRLLKLTLIVVAGLVVLGGAFLWALPETVRRVALDPILRRTGLTRHCRLLAAHDRRYGVSGTAPSVRPDPKGPSVRAV